MARARLTPVTGMAAPAGQQINEAPHAAGAPASRRLRAAGVTDVGRRRTSNEDRFFVDTERGIFVVVDGIGGHAAGDRAADTAMAALLERLARQTGPVTDRVREAITIANNEVHRLAGTRADWHGMACVLTVAVLSGTGAVVGHVGDSRLYRIRGSQIEKITPDHSPIGEREDAHELSEIEAMRHPRRNEVYRDVGSDWHSTTDDDFAFIAEIELPTDAALLLCSDGLTDLVPSERIRQIASDNAGIPERVAQDLIDAANDAGGKDNVTAVIVEGEAFASGASDALTQHARGLRARPWTTIAAVVVSTVAGIAIGTRLPESFWSPSTVTEVIAPPVPDAVVVSAGDSIATAIAEAPPGSDVVVEPGEYRERLTLKAHMRVVSRLPRGAVIRLPAGAPEDEAAVVAENIEGAELAGFLIVGDAATPLGVGVLSRAASVRLTDIEVRGAALAALDLGAGDVTLVGGDIHDNPGAALVVRAGASPRIAHSAFARNGLSPKTAAAVVVEPEAHPTWTRNVFQDLSPDSLGVAGPEGLAAIARDNWFVSTRPVSPRPAVPGRGRSGR